MKKHILTKDERILGSFESESAAAAHLLRIQPASISHAVKHEGYMIDKKELVPIEEIKLTRAEGRHNAPPEIKAGASYTVDDYINADDILALWSRDAHNDKIDFTITFADGEQYEGTYILEPAPERPNLRQHVVSFLECYAGYKKPDHMSPEEWEKFKSQQKGRELWTPTREFYNTYDVHAKF